MYKSPHQYSNSISSSKLFGALYKLKQSPWQPQAIQQI